jgi:hypothetical protein
LATVVTGDPSLRVEPRSLGSDDEQAPAASASAARMKDWAKRDKKTVCAAILQPPAKKREKRDMPFLATALFPLRCLGRSARSASHGEAEQNL